VAEVVVILPERNEDIAALRDLQQMGGLYGLLVQIPSHTQGPYVVSEKARNAAEAFVESHPRSVYAGYVAFFLGEHYSAVAREVVGGSEEESSQVEQKATQWRQWTVENGIRVKLRTLAKTRISETASRRQGTSRERPTTSAKEPVVDSATRKSVRDFLDEVEDAIASNDPERIRTILATKNPRHDDLDEKLEAVRKEFPERFGHLTKENFGTPQKEVVERTVEAYRKSVEEKGPFGKVAFTIESIERDGEGVSVRCRTLMVTGDGEEVTEESEESGRLSLVKQDGQWRLLGF
jgi:hypothetical protein